MSTEMHDASHIEAITRHVCREEVLAVRIVSKDPWRLESLAVSRFPMKWKPVCLNRKRVMFPDRSHAVETLKKVYERIVIRETQDYDTSRTGAGLREEVQG